MAGLKVLTLAEVVPRTFEEGARHWLQVGCAPELELGAEVGIFLVLRHED